MIWYPYEQMKTMAPPISITGAKGVYLYTEKGKMIDSVSSWWSVIHGYNHPELARKYNVTERWVRQLCGDGKLEGQLEFFDILTGTDGLGDTT